MTTLEVRIDDRTLAAVRRLATSRNCSVEELLSQILAELSAPTEPIGLFQNDAGLLDEIVDDAMKDREVRPLRV